MAGKKVNKKIMFCKTNEDGDEGAYIFNSGFPGKVIVVYEDAYGELEVRRLTCQQALENLGTSADDEIRQFLNENKRDYYDKEPKYQ